MLLNLTVKKYENCSTFAEVIIKIKVARFFQTRCIIYRTALHISWFDGRVRCYLCILISLT